MDASTIPPMVKNFFFILILVYLVVGLVSFVYILNHGFRTENRNRDLQNKMLSAQLRFKEQELNYLKKQIHPHFLFNTLNTLYGLAMKRSENTPEVILKLSNLLDYILYQVDKPEVTLEEEVGHIHEYIELERIRFRDTLEVDFRAEGITGEFMIAPMILIPLVENAFKHGEALNGKLEIGVNIKTGKKELEFHITNSAGTANGEIGEHGMGLENLRKRLELNYGSNFHLENQLTGGIYLAHLKINKLQISDHG
jgi:hypothetical protein